MSSWNSLAKSGRRIHKERHQPEHRQHLGQLEKKKDYKERARNYHLKEDKLKELRKKALDRNPDEFHFHMINSCMEGNYHFEKPKEEHTDAQWKLMQSQDSNYINFKLSAELKKIERLKAELHLLDADDKPKNTHTFFVDKTEAKKFDIAKKLRTHPSLLDRTYNRPTLEALKTMHIKGAHDKMSMSKLKEDAQKQYNELSKRIERANELLLVRQKLYIRKKLLNKNDPPAEKLKESTKTAAPVYVWKKERKR